MNEYIYNPTLEKIDKIDFKDVKLTLDMFFGERQFVILNKIYKTHNINIINKYDNFNFDKILQKHYGIIIDKISLNNIYKFLYLLINYIPKYKEKNLYDANYIKWFIDNKIIYNNDDIGIQMDQGDIFNAYFCYKYNCYDSTNVYVYKTNNINLIVLNSILDNKSKNNGIFVSLLSIKETNIFLNNDLVITINKL